MPQKPSYHQLKPEIALEVFRAYAKESGVDTADRKDLYSYREIAEAARVDAKTCSRLVGKLRGSVSEDSFESVCIVINQRKDWQKTLGEYHFKPERLSAEANRIPGEAATIPSPVVDVEEGHAESQGEPRDSTLAEAISCFQSNRLLRAKELFEQVVEESGDHLALNHLGWMYQNGLGVAVDTPKAAALYRSAADAGNTNGQSNFAHCLFHGIGIEANVEQALRYYRLAADKGCGLAMNQLGWAYQQGNGVVENHEEAFNWYQRSASAGNLDGLNNLAWMYRFGLGTKQNIDQALKVYRVAVERGHPSAQRNMQMLLEEMEQGR